MANATARTVQNKDRSGAIKAVYAVLYNEANSARFGGLGTVQFDATNTQTVTSLFTGTEFDATNTLALYRIDLRNESSGLTWNINPSRENGTTFVEHMLALHLPTLLESDIPNVYDYAIARYQFIVQDYNNNLFLVGLENGADMEPSTGQTGNGMGEFSGHTVSFKAKERRLPNWVQEGAIWTTGNVGSITADQIRVGISINGVAGTAT